MIGVIGLGKMGRAIANRLEACDEALVVWNRTPGRNDGLSAELASTPAKLCDRTDIVLSVLSDDAAISAVYESDSGILAGDLSGKTIVEFCTMSPDRARRLDRQVSDAGGAFLECPVGGTIGPAEKGALLGLAGGSPQAFEAARPVLEKLTRRLEHVGPVGNGAAMKLAINLPLMVYWSALGEALSLAMAEGVDPTLALDILADSSGAIGAAKGRVPPIREMVVNGDPGGVNFALQTALKDMGEMVAVANAHGLRSDVISAARSRAKAALDDGWSARDASLTAAYGNTFKPGS